MSSKAARIINRNMYLFGPGPLKRVQPPGLLTSYSRMEPATGFAWAAIHGVIFSLTLSSIFKYMVLDPQIKTIEDYYKENPPR